VNTHSTNPFHPVPTADPGPAAGLVAGTQTAARARSGSPTNSARSATGVGVVR
jgi:hypothetical protein